MADRTIAEIAALFEGRGAAAYGLAGVNQAEHALQTASLAERDDAGPALTVAALLHDIGHLVADLGDDPAADGIDDRHEAVGHAWLASRFPPEVTEPVRLHVAAKRWLCGTEPGYFARLAPDSVRSLALQGGPMAAAAAVAFAAQPHAEAAIRLRRWDEAAKVVGLPTPPVAYYAPLIAGCLANRDSGSPAGRAPPSLRPPPSRR